MIITKKDPFIKKEIEQLKEEFEVYIETVIGYTQDIGARRNVISRSGTGKVIQTFQDVKICSKIHAPNLVICHW